MAKTSIKKEIALIKKTLKKRHTQKTRFLLFGSHVTGFATDRSDIDLCIVCTDNSTNVKSLQRDLNSDVGFLGVNADIIVTTEDQLKRNFISPILHEIRKNGVPV